MSDKTTPFGRLCRSNRARIGLNMTQAAERLGVVQPTLTNYEQGKESPSLEFIRASMEIYGIKDRAERMRFLLSALESSEKIEIPLKELGPLRKESLAALYTLYDVRERHPEGWAELMTWLETFFQKLKDKERISSYRTLGSVSAPI